MQLLYIWIKKYACLENANLNFCENPRFEFNENNKKLNIIKNETNISIFPLQKEQFDEPNCIDNISIIVGSNGAGKTSICKFLYDLYFYHAKISNYIIIYKINGKKYITSDYQLNISELNIFELIPTDLKHCPFNMLYYSPIYSNMHQFQTMADVNSLFEDTSTSFTLKKDIETYKNETTGVEYTDNTNPFMAHQILDNNRFAGFLSHFLHIKSNVNLGITLPEYVYFTYDRNTFNLFEQECNTNDLESIIYTELSENINQKNNKDFFIDTIALEEYCTFCRIFLLGNKTGHGEILQKEYQSILNEHNFKDKEKSVTNHILEIFSDFSENFREAGIWIRFIEELKALDITHYERGYVKFRIKDESQKWCFFNALYRRMTFMYEFGEFYFYPLLSTGEYSELQIYSRLLEGISEIQKNNKNQNFILFLDESEITLHPKLEQHLIKNIIIFLNELYIQQNLKFHIIFATHSPIILSDIPKNNVIFLRKDENQTKTVVTDLAKNNNTFAASIFELYKESFFIDTTTTGSFAKEIINKAIESDNKELKKYIINSIGDKLLKGLINGEYQK